MVLSHRTVSLRPVQESDLPFLFRLLGDPNRVHLWMRGRPVYDEAGFQQAWGVWKPYGPLSCIRTPLPYNLPEQQCRHQRSATMPVTASKLRENIYRILDQVLETGVPVEIERRGKILKIVPTEMPKKLDNLIDRRDFVRGDPEDIVHLDWSSAWRP